MWALGGTEEQGNEWVEIGRIDPGEYYLNRRSIEDHGSYVTGWVRMVLSDAEIDHLEWARNSGASYMMILNGATKGTRQIRSFQQTTYDKNGRPIATATAQELEQWGLGQWQYCTPGSISEAVWEALMKAAGIRY